MLGAKIGIVGSDHSPRIHVGQPAATLDGGTRDAERGEGWCLLQNQDARASVIGRDRGDGSRTTVTDDNHVSSLVPLGWEPGLRRCHGCGSRCLGLGFGLGLGYCLGELERTRCGTNHGADYDSAYGSGYEFSPRDSGFL